MNSLINTLSLSISSNKPATFSAKVLLPWPKKNETAARQLGTDACSLEHARACGLACVAVSIFFGQGSINVKKDHPTKTPKIIRHHRIGRKPTLVHITAFENLVLFPNHKRCTQSRIKTSNSQSSAIEHRDPPLTCSKTGKELHASTAWRAEQTHAMSWKKTKYVCSMHLPSRARLLIDKLTL